MATPSMVSIVFSPGACGARIVTCHSRAHRSRAMFRMNGAVASPGNRGALEVRNRIRFPSDSDIRESLEPGEVPLAAASSPSSRTSSGQAALALAGCLDFRAQLPRAQLLEQDAIRGNEV